MQPRQEAIWSVSALNFEIKTMLEQGIGSIWIEGEVSNFAAPASGHWYFSLKDDRAQLRAAMFRNRNQRAGFTPKNGQQVLIRAQVTLYEARGDFQVIVEHIEDAGAGRLMREFEVLKRKLDAEGLFAQSRKRPVPRQARRIGLITSASGAAIRDVLSVIRRRSPSSEVTLYPTSVQGEAATTEILKALDLANRHAACEVLLLVRGGGSLEDLWCFNREEVARAIADSDIPVVSGVGHEIDTTIADYVADLRAPTPSVAAESVTMDQYEIMQALDRLSGRLQQRMQQQLTQASREREKLATRLMNFHPQRQMQNLTKRLGFAYSTLCHIQQTRIDRRQAAIQLMVERLRRQSPEAAVAALRGRVDSAQMRLLHTMRTRLMEASHRLALNSRNLDSLSPLQTLARGYTTVAQDGQLVQSAQSLKTGDDIEIRFHDGSRGARIT
jgi:exodeoxyribonuclease VII large subunit